MSGLTFFVCNRCNAVDAVSLAGYTALPSDTELQLCSECNIGKWHGWFEKEQYDPEQDLVANRASGFGLG